MTLIGQQLLSRHDELKERARQLLEATKREAKEKERMKRLSSKEKEDSPDKNEVNGLRNGDIESPKKVGLSLLNISYLYVCYCLIK